MTADLLNFDDIFINLRFVDEIKYPLLKVDSGLFLFLKNYTKSQHLQWCYIQESLDQCPMPINADQNHGINPKCLIQSPPKENIHSSCGDCSFHQVLLSY